MLQAFLLRADFAQSCASATAAGLRSYLVEDPNDLVSAMNILAQLGRTSNLVSCFLVMLLDLQDALVLEVTWRRYPAAHAQVDLQNVNAFVPGPNTFHISGGS